MRRCQRSSAGAASPDPSAASATLWPKVTEFSSVCQVSRKLGAGRPAAAADDLVALGHQAAHRLDREEVVGARFEPGPAGAAERAGEARPVDDPRPLLVAEAVERGERLLGPGRAADDAEPAALAAAHRGAEALLLGEPAEERLAAGGAGRVVGAGSGLERDVACARRQFIHAL